MRFVGLATAAGILAAVALAPAAPALAHGAPTQPISRTAACASGGEETRAKACQAARKANGGSLGNFDNLRIANVGGRDKRVVPDGELCSGGLDDYRGLDLARTDWPATEVEPGTTLKVRYAGTIPHKGTFRLYLTKAGYDPSEPLSWGDLTTDPVTEVTDPPLRDGSYRMSVKLPENRSGRHVLYVVWETSSTPDTYYSCSDLIFPAEKATPAPTTKAPAIKATKKPSKAPETTAPASAGPPSRTAPASKATRTTEPPALDPVASHSTDDASLGHWIIGGALAVIVVALVVGFATRSSRAH
ncbi:lytic polysaccharide monooxygenase auxiliary activity family 9 protein [Symbioplanes lichenis]|uniref:lytic polysaccharide monooxygenase auxiliary activity family 9 protein n=1 Tax=Symbioplanes lichenis TaxID=1629072 RepID=UPI002738920A|nr:lytic polysaccharide monooxygenase [Actinoplanes lichenis]